MDWDTIGGNGYEGWDTFRLLKRCLVGGKPVGGDGFGVRAKMVRIVFDRFGSFFNTNVISLDIYRK